MSDKFGEEKLEKASRDLALVSVDEVWADYLASVSELKSGVHWISWGGGDPLYKFLSGVQQIYADFWVSLERDIAETLAAGEVRSGEIYLRGTERFERGATWTYLTTDQPFGTITERIISGLRRRLPKHSQGHR